MPSFPTRRPSTQCSPRSYVSCTTGADRLDRSGAADHLATVIVATAGAHGPWLALVTVGVQALGLTQPLHNAVAAIIASPVAFEVARSLDATPRPFAMAVLAGVSCSCLLPVGHPAPQLVKGPGGYRTADYVRFGAGIIVIVLATIGGLVPLLWPLGATPGDHVGVVGDDLGGGVTSISSTRRRGRFPKSGQARTAL